MSRNRNTSDPLTKQSSISSISSHVPLLAPLSNVDPENSIPHGTTDLQTFLDSMKTNSNRDSKRGRTICQPKGTIPYTVERNDTLEKIALHFNLTPSELIHLNKLNSRIVFPGQILYVPESISSEIPPTNVRPSVSPRTKENDVFLLHADRRLSGSESSSPPFISHLHQQQDVGPMVWSMTRQSTAKPGHAQRLKSETSIESETSSRTVEDRLKSQKEDNTKQVRQIQKTLSIDENRQLDEECLQRFLKVNVQLVTEDHKKIAGVLLVTPNAVMFDPDVLDPAVKEYGIEKFGLIIRMDLLAGVAMYEDIGLYDHEVTTRDEEKRRICHSTSIKNLHQTSLKLIDIDEEQVRDVLVSLLDQIEKDNEDNVLKVFDASSTHHPKTKSITTDISTTTTFQREDLKHSIGILFNDPTDKSLFLDAFDERQYELQLENCVSLGDINRRFGEIDKLLQKQHEIYVAPHPIEIPYYLCLKTSLQINEKASSSSSMDDVYGRKELDGEYWFSVPKEKVDHLYAFFLRWTPERESETNSNKSESTIIGTSQSSTHLTRSSSQHQTKSNEKLTKTNNAKGFVLLNPDDYESTEDYLLHDNKTSRARTATTTSTDSNQKEQKKSHYLKRQNTLLKEWEIINVEEIYRRINAAQANNAHLEDISAIPAPKLLQPSTLINEQQSKEILLELPARVHGLNWQLVFSTEQHGFSLNQLYRRGIESDLDTPALLIVRDVDQNVFGAYVSQQFTVSEGFYGTGESFLFTFHPEFQVFKWTGHNQFFIKGDVKALGIGCGEGIYGLWLDADLYHGRTCPSKTFNNARLTSKEDFIIASVEVWTFVD